jgi:dTDP-4-dehydrorhamnose 3,5-epimerase
MIDGVEIVPLEQFRDERGKVMHMLREDAIHFERFGEIYFSTIHPGAIKAWHRHQQMTLNYAVIFGEIKFVLFDDRSQSTTFGQIHEVFLSTENYSLVKVPPLVWNGFKGIGDKTAIVANCATLPHNPDEIERLEAESNRIPYSWGIRHK